MKLPAIYKRKSNTKLYSSGFTLLEILVAIIILSFGLLGMVGIQAMALKSNNDAKQQSAAVQLAGELSDMMRGNKAIAVGLTPAANPYLIADYVGGGAIPNPPEDCNAPAGCTSSLNVASWEKSDWLNRVNATFPGARVQVCFDDAPYTTGVGAGIPQWGCGGVATVGGSISIKIGWVRASTNNDRSSAAAVAGALTTVTGANASPPSVIYLVTPGSSGV
jgi:type IV pilus assembly protein PilV